MKLNVGTLVLILIAAVAFGYQAARFPADPHRVIGLSLAAVSLALLVVSRLQLGRAFSVQARASDLVTSGIYSRIRNPVYIFSSLMIAGVIVWSGYPWFLLIFLVLVPLQLVRARNESRVLEEKFGPAYVAYKRKTWF